jgi:signal transduction histidine kinase
MPRHLNVIARSLGFTWVGILMFGVYPPPAGGGLVIQITAYCLAALGLAAWSVLDFSRSLSAHRARWLPAPLAVIAVASGAGSAIGSGGTAMVVFGFVAAMVVNSDCDLSVGLAVTIGGALATDITGLAYSASYGTLVGLPTVVLAGLMIGRNRAAYRIRAEQAAALLAQAEQLQAEHRRADLLDERARIAREIHDVLAHSLGALGIQIQAARSALTDYGDVTQASELLAAAQRMASEGLVETRRAVSALRVDALPLEQELATATTTYADRYGVAVTLRTDGTPRPVRPDATLALLRVGQEAIVNAAKHAPGQRVTIQLEFGPADLRLIVRNDLASPAAEPETAAEAGARLSTADTGYGLTSMRERLRLQNGTLEARPADGQWTVTAWLPLALGGVVPAAVPGQS